ncbi:hypothetical protein [Vibrio vulnificus]|uniref:hypothetical protein n=1 Tax=Vibrio vulnificus TaxID=672 RepID=UPI000D410F89|nr:hypothetical protein [Vibrio vulnificus]POB68762.1 hypothetical protein CRN59_18430 [Vibrio vulnificus]HDY7818848.1 hypothetical protein [Vibrio vulnificus]
MSSVEDKVEAVKPMAIQFIDAVSPYLEFLYFLSAPALAFFAYKALEQIVVSKIAMQTSSKRESYRLAAERCEYFHKEVSPEIDKFFNLLKEKEIKFLSQCKVTIEGNKLKFVPSEDKEQLKKLVAELEHFHELFNKLELFAMYFTSRIADEELAYHSLGSSYCRLVEKLIPLLMMKFYKEECKHIMGLFLLWNPKIQKLKDEKRIKELQKELSEIQDKEYDDKTVKPIGA